MPRILEKYLMTLDEMQVNGVYLIDARNASIGIWDGKRFIISRFKFGSNYICTELHWDSDPHYGTAKPLKFIEHYILGFDNEDITLEYLNGITDAHQGEVSRMTREAVDSEKYS